MAIVKAKDPGTRRWDFSLDAGGAGCMTVERYDDSDALLAHMMNLGPRLNQLLSLADVELYFLGDMSDQLKAALASVPHRSYPPLFALAQAWPINGWKQTDARARRIRLCFTS